MVFFPAFPFDFKFDGTPHMTYLLTQVVMIHGIFVLCFVNMYGKAGYCRWCGLLAIMPLTWPVLALVLGFGHWPLVKEVCRLRLLDNSASEKDAYEVLNQADRLFKNGDFEKGQELCQRVASAFGETDPGRSASIMLAEATEQYKPPVS